MVTHYCFFIYFRKCYKNLQLEKISQIFFSLNVILYMRIIAQKVCANQPNYKANNNCCAVSANGLKQDTFTPSFTALKKSMLDAMEFALVEKLKAPIEKYSSVDEFTKKWVEQEYYARCSADFAGRSPGVRHKRENMVCDWDLELSLCKYTDTEKLLIIDGITRDLKPTNDTICPVFDKDILDKTMREIKTELNKNRKYQFNFGKIYRKNLVDMYAKKSERGNNESKWIVIPSKDNDPEHFKENVEKLQSLSTEHLCTKHSGAEFHLRDGDIHIYLENGKPKVLLRFNDGLIQEINGELNNYRIPPEYVELTQQYIFNEGYVTTPKADEMLMKSMDDVICNDEPIKEPINKSKTIFEKIKAWFKNKRG